MDLSKGDARMAADRRRPRPDVTGAASARNVSPDFDSHGVGALAPGGRGELLSLMTRLRDELDSFLDDVADRRESSRNRDSSGRPARGAQHG
jgi:hypothetical protein